MKRRSNHVTYENYRKTCLDSFHNDFAEIWARDTSERSVFDLWLHVVDHASRIARAIRRQEPPAVIDDIADTTVWLMSFCAYCQTRSGTSEANFHFNESPAEIIWQKYPGTCPACFDSWIISLLDLTKSRSAIEQVQLQNLELSKAIDNRVAQFREFEPCSCLSRIADRNKEREIASSIRIDLDAFRVRYANALRLQGKVVSGVAELERMFDCIYANWNHVLTLELTAFHLLEEVGEATEALKDIYTFDESREPYSETLCQLRRSRLLDEIGDVFSWLYAISLKISATFGRLAGQYRASISPNSAAQVADSRLSFADIIWSKYGMTRSGANWDRLRCPGCQDSPCTCARDIRFDFGFRLNPEPQQPFSPSNNPMNMPPQRDLIFISYSHKDSEWLQRLQTMLKPLIRSGALTTWDDKQIKPGERWRSEIDSALSRSKVAVLLVSPDFLASDFIAEKELPPLLDAAAVGGTRIIWLPISASLYRETPISDYQSAHDPQRPLNSLSKSELDHALVDICMKIKEAFAS